MSDDAWRLGAIELAGRIANRELSARQAAESVLARIDAVNPALNAVTVIDRDGALAAADAADERQAAGKPLGLLHGVPVTVKENIDQAGQATTMGVVAMKDLVARDDGPDIARLRAAGAIFVGRTNTPDFGLRWHTDNALRGATVNPWNAGVTPGGSSGGAAAALATGMGPIAIGNDLGGSVRYPAQCCGIASLRPTFGRNPRYTATQTAEPLPMSQLMAVNGPMARSVADVRLAYRVAAGASADDPWSVPAPLDDMPAAEPGRVALTRAPGGNAADPQVEAGLDRAAAALRDAGYEVEEMEPPAIAEASNLWQDLLFAEIAEVTYPRLRDIVGPGAREVLDQMLVMRRPLDLPGYMQGVAKRATLLREWQQFLVRYPIVLGPISTRVPFAVGADIGAGSDFTGIADSMRLVITVNLLGLPAAVVPVGADGGLPQAVQLIGARFAEESCLRAAEAIEDRLGPLTPIDPRN
ncbi:amidase [Oceanibacterium hippocampi]|uniref:Acylamidase n=1 Tax=Oceanibacterium hippocampi TaxID=745714 RepID=A0A1Y5TZV8_9PROT|nr:amidase [Oceanibacterium hippocampi]SLN77059.1 Acylamidase [Oceanibacterium hippocampi]